MSERIVREWDAAPSGEIHIVVYETSGIRSKLRGLIQPKRTFDVPSGVAPHLYEPVPVTLLANERIEVVENGEVVNKG